MTEFIHIIGSKEEITMLPPGPAVGNVTEITHEKCHGTVLIAQKDQLFPLMAGESTLGLKNTNPGQIV